MRDLFIENFLVFILFLSNGFAGNNNYYYGHVIDKNSGEQLIGVNIYLEKLQIGTVSDEDGYYYLTVPKRYADTLNAVFQYMGYQIIKKKLNELKINKEVALSPLALELQHPIEIVSQRFKNELGLSHQYIQPLRVIHSASIGDPDIFRYIATQSGVSFTNDFSNKIYIRGTRSDKLFILLDDFVLYNPYHLLSITGSVDIGAIKTVELYKSVYPVNENGRVGGMLKMYTKNGNNNEFNLNLNVSLLSSILRVEAPIIANGSFMISLRRTYVDFITKLFSGEFPYSFYDGIFKVGFNPKNNNIEISGILSNDYYKKSSDNISKWSNAAVGINWKYYYSPKLYFHNNISYSEYRSRYYSNSVDTLSTYNGLEDITYKGNMFYQLDFLNALLNAGVSFHSYKVKFTSDEVMLKNIESDSRSNQVDAFIDYSGTITPSFKFDSGISASYFSTLEKVKVLPLFRMHYLITDSFKVSAGYAEKVQYLNTINNERDYLPPFNIWRNIDMTTGAEISNQFALSIQFQKKKINLSTEIYYNKLDNIVDYNRKYLDEDDSVFIVNQGESYGAELSLDYFNHYFFANINYALSRTIYSLEGKNYYPSFHRLNKVNINILSKKYSGWSASLHWVYSSGRPYTVNGGYYSLHHFGRVRPPAFLYEYHSDYNAAQYPVYHRLDIHIEKKFHNNIRLYLDIINLYNHKNIFYYEYKPENSSIEAIYMLPILPNIGFEYNF